jgi:hypothetical protein
MSLANATISNSSATPLFTCANAGGTAVTAIALTNYSAATATVTLYACPAGETAADENAILHTLSLDAKETYVFEGKLILANTDVLSAQASAATSIVATVSYLNL